MSLPQQIRDELTSNEIQQVINGFPNLNYIDSKTKNTVLHLIAMTSIYFNETHAMSVLERIINGDLIKINTLNERKRTCLMQACRYSNKNFVEYIVKSGKTIDFTLKDDKGINILAWVCDRGFTDVAIELIEGGCPYKADDIEKISDTDFRNKISLILFDKVIEFKYGEIDEDLPEDSNFRIYGENDFIFNTSERIGSGTYGFATIATDKNTGKKVVLKKFQYKDGSQQPIMMTDQIMRDIIFLREMNKKKHSVQIYGLFTDSRGSLYMILEYLERTLNEQYIYIENIKDQTERIKQFKRLIYEMLICVDGNSRAGIIHCDTKGDNLMIDSKGRVRNIDYGFSYFLGISPAKENISHRIHHGIYLMQDGREEKIENNGKPKKTIINCYDGSLTQKLFSIDSGFLTYNLDIGSIGLFFIQRILGYDHRYIFKDGKIYQITPTDNYPQCDTYKCVENKTIINRLKNKYGDELTNLICQMIEIDWAIRPTAKEIIFSPLFDNMPCNYPRNLDITNILEVRTSDNLERKVYQYNTVFSSNYDKTGFIYYDDIIKHWSNTKITLVNTFQHTGRILDALSLLNDHINFDSYFSFAIYINSIISRITRGEPCPFTIEDFRNNNFTCIIILALKSNIYQDNDFDIDSILDFLGSHNVRYNWFDQRKNNANINQIKDVCLKVKRDADFFRLTPVMVYIGYIKFILQAVCNNGDIIKQLIIKLTRDISRFLTLHLREGNKNLIEVKEYDLFDLVKHIYYSNPDAIDINLRPVDSY